jgi:hypothetical protein
MARIPEQSDPPLAPTVHRATNHERPFARCLDFFDDRMDIRMPTVKIVCQLIGRALGRPGFNLPIVAFDSPTKFMSWPRRMG